MLGRVLGVLTNPAGAEDALSSLGDTALLQQVRDAAGEHGVTPGEFVAGTIRHQLDTAGDEVWLDLIGRMQNAPQPGVAALKTILALAFPVPVAP
jgi:anthranilate phosphoribosyltransferase